MNFGRRISLSTQVSAIHTLGLWLNRELAEDELIEHWDREEYERHPYYLLMVLLGTGTNGRYLTNDLWHFDPGGITKADDYGAALMRLMQMAGGRPPIKDLRVRLDQQAQGGTLSFTLDGAPYTWDIEIGGDRADMNVLIRFMRVLEGYSGGRWFAISDDSEFIACISHQQRKRLNRLSGSGFEWIGHLTGGWRADRLAWVLALSPLAVFMVAQAPPWAFQSEVDHVFYTTVALLAVFVGVMWTMLGDHTWLGRKGTCILRRWYDFIPAVYLYKRGVQENRGEWLAGIFMLAALSGMHFP